MKSSLISLKVFLTTFFLLLIVDFFAQNNPPAKHWQFSDKSNVLPVTGEDWLYNIMSTSDGGYLGCGYTEINSPAINNSEVALVKLDAHGNVVWDQIFDDGNSADHDYFVDEVEVSDGYVILGIGENDLQFFKVDKRTGVVLVGPIYFNSLNIGTEVGLIYSSIREIRDASYVVTGYIIGTTATLAAPRAMLIKLDVNGNLDLSFNSTGYKTYGNNTSSARNARVIYDVLGNPTEFVFTGYINNGTDDDVYVVKTDLGGNVIWQNNYAETTLTGYIDNGPDATLCSTCFTSTETNNEHGFSIEQKGNGGNLAILAWFDYQGFCFPPSSGLCSPYNYLDQSYLDIDGALFELDLNGIPTGIAVNVAHYTGIDFFTPFVFDGTDYVILGADATNPALVQSNLTKIDGTNGNVKWTRNVQGDGSVNCPFGLDLANDGGYIIAGNNEIDDEDYLAIKLYSDCQTNVPFGIANDIFINGQQTISSSQSYKGVIYVQAGGSLTISGTNTILRFADTRQLYDFDQLATNTVAKASGIVILPGGKVTIIGATLKGINACGSEYMWQGIRVEGNPNASQLPSTNQGLLIMTSAKIENALMGVLLNDVVWNQNGHSTVDYPVQMGGGIIRATNCTFLNCARSSHFTPYTYSIANPNNTSSFFTGCNFTNDAPLVDPDFIIPNINNPNSPGIRTGNNSFVSIWEYNGLKFHGNTFKSTVSYPSPNALALRGNGIVSWDANFIVDRKCDIVDQNGNCAGARNVFEGLNRGIDANTSTGIGLVNIKGCYFKNNAYGIVLNATTLTSITNNIFDIPLSDGNFIGDGDANFGIYSTSAWGYKIEENTFNTTGLNSSGGTLGVLTRNATPGGGSIYRNTFNNIVDGNQAEAYNIFTNIDCNSYSGPSFTPTFFDWAITSGNLGSQGSCTPNALPAKNTFSSSAIGVEQIFHYSSLPASLIYSAENGTTPTFVTFPEVFAFPCVATSTNQCLSTLTGCDPNCWQASIQQIKNQIASAQQPLIAGNSQNLSTIISTGTPNQIKNALLAKSPYLSDRVLIAAINHSLPPGILKDIIIPNSPVSPAVMAALNSISIPNGIRNQINNAQTGVSERTLLEAEIASMTTDKVVMINEVTRQYLDSNLVNNAIAFLNQEGSLEAICALVPLNIKKGDTATALLHITSIRVAADSLANISLSDPKVPVLRDFCDFHQFVMRMQLQPGSYFTMTPFQEQLIRNEAQSDLPMAINSQSILKLVFGEKFPRVAEPIILSNNLRITPENNAFSPDPFCKLFPNPNNGNMTFEYKLADNEMGEFKLYDMTGRLLSSYILENGTNSLNISEAALKNGVYFYKYIVNNEIRSTDKIIIIR